LNGSFDSGTTSWSTGGTGVLTVQASQRKFGTNAARLQGTAADDRAINTLPSLSNGSTYTGSI
jgi:hypothetical protein